MPSPVTAPPRVMVLQLRHDQRHQPVRQGRVDELLVGAHALHVGGAARRGRPQMTPVEPADVEPGRVGGRRGRGTGWRCAWPAGPAGPPGSPVVGLQPLPRRAMTCKTDRVGHPHPPPLSHWSQDYGGDPSGQPRWFHRTSYIPHFRPPRGAHIHRRPPPGHPGGAFVPPSFWCRVTHETPAWAGPASRPPCLFRMSGSTSRGMGGSEGVSRLRLPGPTGGTPCSEDPRCQPRRDRHPRLPAAPELGAQTVAVFPYEDRNSCTG